MRYLGIDYGTKNIGLATSDDAGQMAFPFKVISAGKRAVKEVAEICQKEKIEKIIVGESVNLNGEPNPVMAEIIRFKKALEKESELSIDFEKEYFTSRAVAREIGEDNFSDARAASLILQTYLDRQKNTQL